MPVVSKVTIRGVSAEQYDKLRDEVGWLNQPPIGGILHIAWWEGADAHGLDVWESPQDWEKFGRDRMGPAMAALGIDAQPEVEFIEPHEVFVPGAITLT